jgi:tRNA dimethylallyltransferase
MSGEMSANKTNIKDLLKQVSIDSNAIKKDLLDDEKIIVICGPTGIGKSRLGIEIARIFDTDIISADSMQVYKGMDIGTDKVDSSALGVRQYMIDLYHPDRKMTVKDFKDMAEQILIEKFQKAKKVPIVVGGSGMYIRALIDGIDESPGEDRVLRDKMSKDMESNGTEKYYEKLKEIDSEYAARISINDKRRILRALEVYLSSGVPYSKFQRSWKEGARYRAIMIGLDKDRPSLYQAIEDRVDRMFKKGLVDEVKELVKKGYGNCTSLVQAVGYKEVVRFLEKEISLEECKKLVKQGSRRLAKKQMTWFTHDERIRWLSVDNYDNIFDLITDAVKLIAKG